MTRQTARFGTLNINSTHDRDPAMKPIPIQSFAAVLMGALLLAACSRRAAKGGASAANPLPDIEPGKEIFEFQPGMTSTQLYEQAYRISSFRWTNGFKPWFGCDKSHMLAESRRRVPGEPREIEAFFTDGRARNIDIRYSPPTPEERTRVLAVVQSNMTDWADESKTFTNRDGSPLLLFSKGDASAWLLCPPQDFKPIEIKLHGGQAKQPIPTAE